MTNHPRGTAHHNTKLTPEAVIEIRRRRTERKEPLKSIAFDFGLTVPGVFSIVSRRNWAHVP